MEQLREFLLHLADQEEANGSDRVKLGLRRIVESIEEKTDIEDLACEVYDLLAEDRQELLANWEEKNK